jgi:cell volume regulation protein A
VPQVFSVRSRRPSDGDPAHPDELEGAAVVARLRIRRDANGSLVLLADGRYALTSPELLAVGGRFQLGAWCARRLARVELSPQDRAWLEEVAGALASP